MLLFFSKFKITFCDYFYVTFFKFSWWVIILITFFILFCLFLVWRMMKVQSCHHQRLPHHHVLLQREAELQSSIICLKRFKKKLPLKRKIRLLFFFLSNFWILMNGMEQRRRSKINEKLKALQNLIPNSNKVMYFC